MLKHLVTYTKKNVVREPNICKIKIARFFSRSNNPTFQRRLPFQNKFSYSECVCIVFSHRINSVHSYTQIKDRKT